MSQKFVALSVGVSAPMVSQWESGIKEPSKENIVKLADLFGVTTDYLLGHDSAESDSALTVDERQLLVSFRQLNETGKAFMLQQADFALNQSSFRQDTSISSVV